MRPAGGPYARSRRQIDRPTSGRIRATAAGHTQARACELAGRCPEGHLVDAGGSGIGYFTVSGDAEVVARVGGIPRHGQPSPSHVPARAAPRPIRSCPWPEHLAHRETLQRVHQATYSVLIVGPGAPARARRSGDDPPFGGLASAARD
jgi:hypothetical protein